MTAAIKQKLQVHLQEKWENHSWLTDCREKEDGEDCFPYGIVENGKATFSNHNYIPRHTSTVRPHVPQDGKPCYLVMIPQVYGEDLAHKVACLIDLFAKEAFDEAEQVRQRMAIVIGVNRAHSINPSRNKAFCEDIDALPRINEVACRVFGFFWQPQWRKTNDVIEHLYPRQKAFLVLKALAPKRAEVVRVLHETGKALQSQIPFGGIRERIKEYEKSKYFARYFFDHAPDAPVYFSTMDADCQRLWGLYSRFDGLIEAHAEPSALTLGYRVSPQERVLIQLAIKIDMRVRAAMNSAIPYSAYFPEPCSLFRLKKSNEDPTPLSRFSFAGAVHGLENRRLIQNGRASGILDDDAVFAYGCGVEMATCDRMKTLKNGRVQTLTPAVVKQKQFLQTLRGLSQTHAMPLQWAENLYAALRFKVSQVYRAKTPLAHIFGVFDPISRMFAVEQKYSARIFDRIMQGYKKKLTKTQKQILQDSRRALRDLGMKTKMIDRIVEAARRSGKAIYKTLAEET